MKPKHFHSRHISITIKPPSDKALDLEDEYDLKQAMKKLQAEFAILVEDVNYEMFNTISLPSKKALPE